MTYTRGGVELPPVVPLEGGVEDGVLLDGMLLPGISLGGNVLGVALPVFGEQGPATVDDLPAVPVVPVELLVPGVVLPMVPAGVPFVVELEVPVVLEVPFVPHGPTVVAVVPLGTVDWLGVVVVEELGLVVVDWLGVVVVDCDGVTPVELGIPGVAEGFVCVADGVPTVPAAPGVVAVVPGCVLVAVPGAPAVPVPEPVVCAAATAMATVSANEANKIFFIENCSLVRPQGPRSLLLENFCAFSWDAVERNQGWHLLATGECYRTMIGVSICKVLANSQGNGPRVCRPGAG